MWAAHFIRVGGAAPPAASRCSARTSLRTPCILVMSPGCAEDVVKGLGQTVAPLVSSRPSGSLIVPVLPCREPEQLPGPHCEPASRKVGRVQAICESGGRMAAEMFIGIDVARDGLDVAVRAAGEQWQVGNHTAGIAELLVRLRALRPTLIVLEATGGLELPVLGV